MRNVVRFAVAAAALATAPALAQTTATPASTAATPLVVRAGEVLRASDGKFVGTIDKVQAQGGQVISVSLIVNQRFVRIPGTTLSRSPKGVVTSLSRHDIALLS